MGVTILAILGFIGGIGCIALGIMLSLLGPLILASLTHSEMPMLALMIHFGATFFVAYGVAALIVSYGLWTGKSWAWWIYIIMLILGILSSLLSLPHGIVGIVINGLIIYYMTRPHVKQYFGV